MNPWISGAVPVITAATKGEQAPDFTIKTLDETEWKLSAQKGKVVLLYFWDARNASYNDPLPLLQDIWNSHSQDAKFTMIGLGISDKTGELIKQYAAKHELKWPVAWLGSDYPQVTQRLLRAPNPLLLAHRRHRQNRRRKPRQIPTQTPPRKHIKKRPLNPTAKRASHHGGHLETSIFPDRSKRRLRMPNLSRARLLAMFTLLVALGVSSAEARAVAPAETDIVVDVHNLADNKPLSGVQVTLQSMELANQATTAADGSAHIKIAANLTNASLAAVSDGFCSVSMTWQSGTSIPAHIDLVMEPAKTIGGVIVDENDKPLPAASVKCSVIKNIPIRLNTSPTTGIPSSPMPTANGPFPAYRTVSMPFYSVPIIRNASTRRTPSRPPHSGTLRA